MANSTLNPPALLEGLQNDADLRQDMLQFLRNHQKIQHALQTTSPVLSGQEQTDLMVRFGMPSSKRHKNHTSKIFCKNEPILLAQNVLQGRLDKETLATISEKDPACVREAAKIIGQMESMRDALTASATEEPLDKLRRETMNQIFGTADVGMGSADDERESNAEAQAESESDTLIGDSVTFVPPTAHQDQEVANDNETVVENEDDEFLLKRSSAKIIHLFQRAKWPAAMTAVAAAIGFFILPINEDVSSSQEVTLAASDLILSDGSGRARPYFEDRVVAAYAINGTC